MEKPVSYGGFAQVYDTFMDDLDYEGWAEEADRLIRQYGISRPSAGGSEQGSPAKEQDLVVDLGCGTGKFTELMASRGYAMIGIDLSEEMLSLAFDRREALGHETLYLCQDMRCFELIGRAGTFVCTGDSLNYLTGAEDLRELFARVAAFLQPGGLFIFDFKTLHLYRDVIGDDTIAEDREDCSFIWYNQFDEETGINQYDLSVFVREDPESDLYRKYEEVHFQRALTLEEVKAEAERAGLVWLEDVDSETLEEVTEETLRVRAVVRKER